jgi:hypothetical protein
MGIGDSWRRGRKAPLTQEALPDGACGAYGAYGADRVCLP